MIELPEAITIARQFTEELRGKHIVEGNRGNAPHKFAFANRPDAEYAALLPGKTLGAARACGGTIQMAVDPGYILILGEGGERITYHADASTLPKKRQLFLRFADETYLTVTISGWGSVRLMTPEELASHTYLGTTRVMPHEDAFTLDYFLALFDRLKPNDARSIKFFLISDPAVWGIGNGCLQDILFHARLHPRRRACDLTSDERTALHQAIRTTIAAMIAAGGRDSDPDIHGQPGGYTRLLDTRTVGLPCPTCGATIQKIAFLGGACYLCPRCQPA